MAYSTALITTDVNKPVSYANPNHSQLKETITDKQEEEDQLDTCFSDRPVSQTFTRTSCKPIWNALCVFILPPVLPHRLDHLEWERIQPLLSSMTVHAIFRLKVKIIISGEVLMFLL